MKIDLELGRQNSCWAEDIISLAYSSPGLPCGSNHYFTESLPCPGIMGQGWAWIAVLGRRFGVKAWTRAGVTRTTH